MYSLNESRSAFHVVFGGGRVGAVLILSSISNLPDKPSGDCCFIEKRENLIITGERPCQPFSRKKFVGMKTKKVKTSSLVLWLMVGLIFSMIIGITGGAMGFGSRHPQLNLIAKPFVCPGQQMSYTQNVSQIGHATYWSAVWFCVDENSGIKTELDQNMVFLIAGSFYGLIFFVVLLVIVYLYWNSSIGPAKNDSLRLW